MATQRNLIGSVVESAYNFVLEPIIGCIYGAYVLHIPHGILGVAVSVPLVTAFFFSRILMSTVPPPRPFRLPRKNAGHMQLSSIGARRLGSMLATIPVALGLALGSVMGVSSGIYALIGLSDYAVGASHFAANSLGCALIFSVAYMTIGLARSRSVKMQFFFLTSKTIHLIWKTVCFPSVLSTLILREQRAS